MPAALIPNVINSFTFFPPAPDKSDMASPPYGTTIGSAARAVDMPRQTLRSIAAGHPWHWSGSP